MTVGQSRHLFLFSCIVCLYAIMQVDAKGMSPSPWNTNNDLADTFRMK